jgi:hypothetical protein
MRHRPIRVGALAVMLIPVAVAMPADPPRPDPLREHELAIRTVLDSWNDIATALSLIRDAGTAVRHRNTLRDAMIAASNTGKRMAELSQPTTEDDRELCRRVLPLARSVRNRFKRESDRVFAIADLGPETKELAPKLGLIERALDKLIAKGEATGKSDPKLKAVP